jgi:hypothetical protein
MIYYDLYRSTFLMFLEGLAAGRHCVKAAKSVLPNRAQGSGPGVLPGLLTICHRTLIAIAHLVDLFARVVLKRAGSPESLTFHYSGPYADVLPVTSGAEALQRLKFVFGLAIPL